MPDVSSVLREGGVINELGRIDRDTDDGSALAASLRFPSSFTVVFERHYEAVHRYIQQRVGVDLADDLTSETFVVAFDRRAAYDQKQQSARPWLLGIATNLMRRHWRAERRQLKTLERATASAILVDDGDRYPNQLDVGIAVALGCLNARDRDALLLLAWAELTYQEIAVALEVPIGTVRSRISRARHLLQEKVQPSVASSRRLVRECP